MSCKRVTASERIRTEIDALFADHDRGLGQVLEDVARLSLRAKARPRRLRDRPIAQAARWGDDDVAQSPLGSSARTPMPMTPTPADIDGVIMTRQRRDPQARKRAGYQVRQALREEMWASARRNWRRLAVGLLGWVAFSGAAIALMAWWSTATVAAFMAGIMLGLLPFFWQVWVVAAGFAHRGMGGDAEQWTAEELAKLDDRAWTVIHDVPLSRSNVDHVVIGPGRVYAIETKWTSYTDRYVERCARQAERQAGELAGLMAERGAAREVIPLLVVWGPGVADALGEKPDMKGRTRVVAGAHSKVWLKRVADAADRLEIDWPAQRTVLAIVDEHEGQHAQPMPDAVDGRHRGVASSS